ncbi:hypothetical protein ACFX11_036025 [Malus domestica]
MNSLRNCLVRLMKTCIAEMVLAMNSYFKKRIALYHGEPQYYYDVPTQTEECEYDGDGEQKSDTEKSLSEESDNDGDTGDFDTDSSLYDEDNDAMLEDDNFDYNFNDNADTPKSFTGCNKKQKKKIGKRIYKLRI